MIYSIFDQINAAVNVLYSKYLHFYLSGFLFLWEKELIREFQGLSVVERGCRYDSLLYLSWLAFGHANRHCKTSCWKVMVHMNFPLLSVLKHLINGQLLKMPLDAPGCYTSHHVIVCLLCTDSCNYGDARFLWLRNSCFFNHQSFSWRDQESLTTRNVKVDGLLEGFSSMTSNSPKYLHVFDLIYFQSHICALWF